MEIEEDYGVNLYQTFYREYDPQIGRFGGVDILSEKTAEMSVYQFGGNNPVIFNDPTGALHVNSVGQFVNTPEQMMGIFNAEVDSWEGGSGGGGGGGGGGYASADPSGDYSAFWNDFLGSAFGVYYKRG